MSPRWRLGLAITSRVVAAVFGGLALAAGASVCLALAVPDSRGLGLALGITLLVPFWAIAACFGFLATKPWRSWLAYLSGTTLLVATAWILRHAR